MRVGTRAESRLPTQSRAGRNGSADADTADSVLAEVHLEGETPVGTIRKRAGRCARVPAIGSVFWVSFAGLVVAWERSKKEPLLTDYAAADRRTGSTAGTEVVVNLTGPAFAVVDGSDLEADELVGRRRSG